MFKQIKEGAGFSFKGISFIKKNSKIGKLVIAPYIINFIVLILFFYALINYFLFFVDKTFGFIGFLDMPELTVWYKYLLYGVVYFINVILKMLIGIVLFIFSAFIFYLVSIILCSPFYDYISEKTEKILTNAEEEKFDLRKFIKNSVRIIVYESQNALFFLLLPILFLVINLIPVIGNIGYFVLANIFIAYAFTFSFMDYIFGRKVVSFKERISFSKKHFGHYVGFGLMGIIPVINIVFSPIFVVSATIMYMELVDRQRE